MSSMCQEGCEGQTKLLHFCAKKYRWCTLRVKVITMSTAYFSEIRNSVQMCVNVLFWKRATTCRGITLRITYLPQT